MDSLQSSNQDIVAAIDSIRRAVSEPYTLSVDANGWTVERFGTKTRYSKSFRNNAFAVPAGESDQTIGSTNLPVGVTTAMVPAPNDINLTLRAAWTTVDWNFLIRAFDASSTTTQIVVSFHVYVSSARSITVGFTASFVL